MTSAVRVQVSERMDGGSAEVARGTRASYAMRRAAVLSYEQIMAGTGLLPRLARPLAVMPAPAPRAEAARAEVNEEKTEARMEESGGAKFRGVSAQELRGVSAQELARDPLAYPMSPARPPRAARPGYVVVDDTAQRRDALLADIEAAGRTKKQEAEEEGKGVDRLVVEPLEPVAERNGGPPRSVHGSVDVPERSMLTPSQRASLRRPETRLDRNKRPTFVTYTVDANGKK
jgi:hypothetical protein